MESLKTNLKIIAGVLAGLTVVWVVLTVYLMWGVKHYWTPQQYMVWLTRSPGLQVLSYVNVVLLTLVNVLFFTLLYLYFRTSRPVLSLAGFIFIPIYGVINFVCYAIQISAVPKMVRLALEGDRTYAFAGELIQANPGSVVGVLNGYAYGILGIPLLVMGHLLARDLKPGSGFLFMGSGAASLVGAVGITVKSALFAKGLMLGGVLFLLALLRFVHEFRARPTEDLT